MLLIDDFIIPFFYLI